MIEDNDYSSSTKKKPTILILEDDFEQRMMIERHIENNYESNIEATGNGTLAIEIAKKGPIDIGIIDVKLSGTTGCRRSCEWAQNQSGWFC